MNFRPDIYVSSFKKITPELLSSLGVRALLTDLDDTLVPHGCMVIPDEVKNWVAALSENGIGVCIVSNNSEERVRPVAEELKTEYEHDEHKPSTAFIEDASRKFGVGKDEMILMGDQLFTDIAAAKRAKIRCILVEPVGGAKTTVWIRLKRIAEKLIKKNFRKDD